MVSYPVQVTAGNVRVAPGLSWIDLRPGPRPAVEPVALVTVPVVVDRLGDSNELWRSIPVVAHGRAGRSWTLHKKHGLSLVVVSTHTRYNHLSTTLCSPKPASPDF